MSALSFGELNRENPDAPRSSVDQSLLARGEVAGIKESLPYDQICERNGGGVNVIDGLGLQRDFGFADRDILRICAIAGKIGAAVNLIALFKPFNIYTYLFDHARYVPSRE